MSRRAYWRVELALGVVAALAALALLAIGFALAWPLRLDVGVGDDRFVAGFNEPETTGGARFRWTTAEATIALPQLPTGGGAILALRVLNGRPAGQPDLRMRVSANGQPLGELRLAPSRDRVYRFFMPSDRRLDWATRVDLHSDVVRLPNDPRALGGVIDWARLEPLPAVPPPSAWLVLWGLGLGAFGYALPRGAGIGRRFAFVAAIGLAALVAIGIAALPLEVLPFVHRIAALLALGCAGIGLARVLAPAVTTNDQRPKANDFSPRSLVFGRSSFVLGPRVRGSDLPIYLAIAWWLGTLFEFVQAADGVPSVTPPPAMQWIGGALLVLLAGLGGWYALRGRLLPREQARGYVARVALWLFTAAALAHLGYLIWYAFQRQGPDFWILFKGAREWARGGSLYDIQEVLTNHFGHVFKVPPFYGMLFVPFVFQDGERILLYHRILNTILLGATALAWYRMWRLRVWSAAGLGTLILLNCRPMTDTIAFGQVDLLLLLVLTLALWALRDERDGWAGALIALGALLKIYPVLLLAFMVVKRRWWGLIGFALGMLVLNGVAVLVMGWEMHRIYLTQVLPNIGGTTSWVENQTISGFLARFFTPPTSSEIFRERAIALLGLAISGLVGLLGCVLALRPAARRGTEFALQYGQFPLLMVFVVPAAWMHYETLLFLPFAALLLHERDRLVSLPRAAALALSFALVAFGNQYSFYDGTVMGVLTVLGVSYKFYGMALLAGVLAATLLEAPAPAWREVARSMPWLRRLSSVSSQ